MVSTHVSGEGVHLDANKLLVITHNGRWSSNIELFEENAQGMEKTS
jgi:hypothetical protein